MTYMKDLENKKINWRRVINDIHDKNKGKQDIKTSSNQITIDGETGELLQKDKYSDGGVAMNMTPWCQSQLFSKFNMPVKYFKQLMDRRQYDLIERHFNYMRDIHEEKDLMIRTILSNTNKRISRAVLTERYQPFDNDKLVDVIRQTMDDKKIDYKLLDYKNDGLTSYMRMVFPETLKDIQNKSLGRDDIVGVGVNIVNSEVGKSSVKIIPLIFRLQCKNGMLSWDDLDNKSDYYQRHMYIDKNKMYDFVASTINKATNKANEIVNNFEDIKKIDIDLDKKSLANILSSVGIPKKLHEGIEERFNEYWYKEQNLYGIVNSITRVAKEYNQDDQELLESAAGKLTNNGLKQVA